MILEAKQGSKIHIPSFRVSVVVMISSVAKATFFGRQGDFFRSLRVIRFIIVRHRHRFAIAIAMGI